MKILLAAVNSKFIHSNLAVRYLKKSINDLECECIVKEFTINDRIERILQEIIVMEPDIVGISCYIWNIEYVKKIATLIKAVDDHIEIMYGGPEVSFDSMKFLKDNDGEYLIKGEGERTFREFVKAKINIENFSELCKIKGMYLKRNNDIIFGGEREAVDINELPFPYEEDENLDNKIVYYEASRGCPFGCKYCLSSTTHGVRFMNIERVKRDLNYFIKKKVKLVKFVDRTFNCNLEFAEAIWKYLIECDTDATFHFEMSIDLLTPQIIQILKKAPKGRFQFECGVQTTNEEVLKNINRYSKFADIKQNVTAVKNSNNIKQHLDLIAGLPGEDFKSFSKSFDDVYSLKCEEVQLGFLKLLKGSPMRDEADAWGMHFSPYPPYEILSTDSISYKELTQLKRTEEVFDKYYNSGKFGTVLNFFELFRDSAFELYNELGNYFYERGYFERSLSSPQYYKALIDFNNDIIKQDRDKLNEYIKFDYLRFNRRKWVPECIVRYTDKKRDNMIRNILKTDHKDSKDYHIEIFHYNPISMLKHSDAQKGEYLILFDNKHFDIYFDANTIFSKKYNLNIACR